MVDTSKDDPLLGGGICNIRPLRRSIRRIVIKFLLA